MSRLDYPRLLLLPLTLALTGCLEAERRHFKVTLADRQGSILFEDFRSDADDDAGRQEDFNTLIEKFLMGDGLREEYPTLEFSQVELSTRQGGLDGEVRFTFSELADLGLYQHSSRSSILWCVQEGETLVRTNGRRLDPVLPGCVEWDRRAESLEWTVRSSGVMEVPGQASSRASLLRYYEAWDAAGRPPVGDMEEASDAPSLQEAGEESGGEAETP